MEMNADGFPVLGWSIGEGPTVLLLHGWSGVATDMLEIARGMARGGYRAVAFDMPAHGASPGKRTSLVDWMRVLPALEEKLGGFHAIVAHSFGATAATLSLRAGLRAKGAALIGAARNPALFMDRVQQFIGLPPERAEGMGRQLVAYLGRDLSDFDAVTAAASLELPALFLHDPADREVPFAHAQSIAGAWRGSRLLQTPGEGHKRILRSPVVVREVVDFVHRLT
jgi:pimeloyl-ACP methyl ester carboxylesterase